MNKEDRKPLGKAGLTPTEIDQATAVRLERELHNKIISDLLRRGIVYYHSRTDKPATIAEGLPDFAFVVNGSPIAMEIKLPGRKLDDEQRKKQSEMTANGWQYYVVYSFQAYSELIHTYLNNVHSNYHRPQS